MKTRRFFTSFFLALLLIGQLAVPARAVKAPDWEVEAKAALLVDQKTGAVLYALNEHDELYPASLTKIMTCLLVLDAIEEGRLSLSQEITATPTALEGLAEDGSTAGIEAGELLTEPETFSARMAPASLAETTSMQYSSCSTVSTSPTWMPAVLPSAARVVMAEAVAVMGWSSFSVP